MALVYRLDIIYTIIKLARFVFNPSKLYLNIIKKIFRYLKNIINLGIIYSNKTNNNFIQAYYDTDYTKNLIQTKNIIGYILFLTSGFII